MDQSLEDLLNESIAINITNDIGHDVTEYQILSKCFVCMYVLLLLLKFEWICTKFISYR